MTIEITGTPIVSPTPPETVATPTNEVSPAAFLLFLKHKLGGLDSQISSLQRGMQDQLTEQNELQEVSRDLERLQTVGNAIGADGIIRGGPDGDTIDGVQPSEWLAAHPRVARALGIISDSPPNRIEAAQIRDAMSHVSSAISTGKQDMEIHMIEFQNLMQDRSSAVQLVSNCINAMNEATKGIVGNIR